MARLCQTDAHESVSANQEDQSGSDAPSSFLRLHRMNGVAPMSCKGPTMIVMDSGTSTARSEQDLSGLLNSVKFHGEFSTPPRNVFLALAGFRCSPGSAGQPSCFVKLDQVRTDGFTYLVQNGAAATDIYEVTISWLALD
jgi:hypothetical protein